LFCAGKKNRDFQKGGWKTVREDWSRKSPNLAEETSKPVSKRKRSFLSKADENHWGDVGRELNGWGGKSITEGRKEESMQKGAFGKREKKRKGGGEKRMIKEPSLAEGEKGPHYVKSRAARKKKSVQME